MKTLYQTQQQLVLDVSPISFRDRLKEGIGLMGLGVLLLSILAYLRTQNTAANWTAMMIFAGVFVIIGMSIIVTFENVIVYMDKNKDEVVVEKKSLLTKSVRTYQLSKIRVGLLEKQLFGRWKTATGYDVYIQSPFSTMPLTNVFLSFAVKEEILQAIQGFQVDV